MNPLWEELIEIPNVTEDDLIKITCLDKNFLKDSNVGQE